MNSNTREALRKRLDFVFPNGSAFEKIETVAGCHIVTLYDSPTRYGQISKTVTIWVVTAADAPAQTLHNPHLPGFDNYLVDLWNNPDIPYAVKTHVENIASTLRRWASAQPGWDQKARFSSAFRAEGRPFIPPHIPVNIHGDAIE